MEFAKWCRLQWDRVLAVVTGALGTLLIALGWAGVSDTPYIAEQVPYVVSYGLGGVALLVIGATLWLSADLNDEWRTLHRMEKAGRLASEDAVVALAARVQALESEPRELARTS